MKYLALFISVLFHPLLMATYGCVLMFFGIRHTVFDYMTPLGDKLRISLVVFLFTFAFPVLNIFIFYKLKRVPSITLSRQSDRTFPYVMTSMFYFGLFYLLVGTNVWMPLKVFILGAGVAILSVALINLKYKISAHMTGVGGLLGSLIVMSYLIRFDMTAFYIMAIIVAGITGSARLYLKEHVPSQLYSGYLLGAAVQGIVFILCVKFNLM